MKSNKEILKDSMPGFAVTITILLVVVLFNPTPLQLVAGLVLYVFGKGVVKEKPLLEIGKEAIALSLIIGTVYLLYYIFGGKGLWGLVVVVLFLAGVILFRNRKNFLGVIRDIEKKHFGETAEERRERLKSERNKGS